MIFQHTADWIFDKSPHTGKPKTQTSRRVKGLSAGFGIWSREKPKTYAVQPGRGKKAIGRIKITSIRLMERAGDMSQEEAIAEGFSDPEMFRQLWAQMYGAKALDEPRWALAIEPMEAR